MAFIICYNKVIYDITRVRSVKYEISLSNISLTYYQQRLKINRCKRACKCISYAKHARELYLLSVHSKWNRIPLLLHRESAAVSCEFLDYRRLMFCMRAKLP